MSVLKEFLRFIDWLGGLVVPPSMPKSNNRNKLPSSIQVETPRPPPQAPPASTPDPTSLPTHRSPEEERQSPKENPPKNETDKLLERYFPPPNLTLPKKPPPTTKEEIFKPLEDLVGLAEVKAKLHALYYRSLSADARRNDGATIDLTDRKHLIFRGNPGTGKTTVARLVGQILWKTGLLPGDAFVELGPSSVTGQFIGHTEKLIESRVAEACNGVLFIDEAYTLNDEHFGAKAVNTLLQLMETNRERLCVIFAGYADDMDKFLKMNSGLPSRIGKTNIIDFPDYTPEELYQVFQVATRKAGFILSPDAEVKGRAWVDAIYRKRDPKYFGNAREIEQLMPEVAELHGKRVERLRLKRDSILTAQDIPDPR